MTGPNSENYSHLQRTVTPDQLYDTIGITFFYTELVINDILI